MHIVEKTWSLRNFLYRIFKIDETKYSLFYDYTSISTIYGRRSQGGKRHDGKIVVFDMARFDLHRFFRSRRRVHHAHQKRIRSMLANPSFDLTEAGSAQMIRGIIPHGNLTLFYVRKEGQFVGAIVIQRKSFVAEAK